jgi:sulfite exporter TauE/SafE
MIALLGSVLMASILGSPHCAAMCGGFVCFYSGESRRVGLSAHAAYHLSRLAAYVLLGAGAGFLGAGLDRVGALGGIQRGAAIVAGTLLLVWGGTALANALGARLPALRGPRGLHRLIARALAALRDRPPAFRAGAIGALTGLLPCGWLYAWVAVAAGTGSAPAGALVMLAFWIGTVPVLAGLAALARGTLAPLARRAPVVAALLLVVFGALTLTGKLTGFGAAAHRHAAHLAQPGASHHGHR